MRKLVLWDVDGTLLHTDGIAGEVMRAAMTDIFGPMTKRERQFYSGKTDWQIVQETFPDTAHDLIAEKMAEFSAHYVRGMQARRDDLAQRSATMPGVREVLAALHGQMVQTMLTGNVAGVARLKVEVLNIAPYLNIDVGAYGNDHYQREQLVPIAAQRAEAVYGHRFAGHDIVVIGDTPRDIECARANGARVVVVATGPYTCEQLEPHNADALFADLSNVDAAVAAILGE